MLITDSITCLFSRKRHFCQLYKYYKPVINISDTYSGWSDCKQLSIIYLEYGSLVIIFIPSQSPETLIYQHLFHPLLF
jgi:hypothetical protein